MKEIFETLYENVEVMDTSDIIDEEGFSRIVDGTMEDLKKILYFSNE